MKKVRVYFAPFDMEMLLNDEEIEAMEDEYSWEPFMELIGEKAANHFMAWGEIEDVREV